MTRNSLGWLAGIALLLSACNAEPEEWAKLSAIDCEAGSLPGSFLWQAAGLFTPAELGTRAPGPEEAPGHAGTEGLRMGHFSFWTELVDAVPFDMPGNVLCQALLFEDADGAARFVEALEPTAQSLSHAAIGWPLNGDLQVSEVTAAVRDGERLEGRRAFVATREENRSPLEIVLLFEAVEHLVVSVHAGGPHKEKQPAEWGAALDSIRAAAEAALAD